MIKTMSHVEEAGVDTKGIPLIICGFRGILRISLTWIMLQKT